MGKEAVSERFTRRVPCPLCGGAGGFWALWDLDTGRRTPPIRYPVEGPADVWEDCPRCEGEGQVWEVEG